MGGKIEEKVQKKALLLGGQYHKTKVWTWYLLQSYTRTAPWVQFVVIVLHRGCWHLWNFRSCWQNAKVRRKKCRLRPLSTAEAAQQQHELLHGVENFCSVAVCGSATALQERNQTFIFFIFMIFAVTADAAVLHLYGMYGFSALIIYLSATFIPRSFEEKK